MKSVNIKLSNRRPFFYVVVSDFLFAEIITGTTFYLCSVSSAGDNKVIIKNLSLEKYTGRESDPFPAIGTSSGTPYFLPVPWRLDGGTLIQLVNFVANQDVLLSGYNDVHI